MFRNDLVARANQKSFFIEWLLSVSKTPQKLPQDCIEHQQQLN